MLYRGKYDLNQPFEHAEKESSEFDSSRWTSEVYTIQFGQISTTRQKAKGESIYRMSGWGVSQSLRSLLADYSNDAVRQAVEWMADRQNEIVLDILEELQYQPTQILSIEQLFIAVDTELFLTKGLRMPVTCVTNIVPYGNIASGLEKFVAILDPSEANQYIAERKGTSMVEPGERFH